MGRGEDCQRTLNQHGSCQRGQNFPIIWVHTLRDWNTKTQTLTCIYEQVKNLLMQHLLKESCKVQHRIRTQKTSDMYSNAQRGKSQLCNRTSQSVEMYFKFFKDICKLSLSKWGSVPKGGCPNKYKCEIRILKRPRGEIGMLKFGNVPKNKTGALHAISSVLTSIMHFRGTQWRDVRFCEWWLV